MDLFTKKQAFISFKEKACVLSLILNSMRQVSTWKGCSIQELAEGTKTVRHELNNARLKCDFDMNAAESAAFRSTIEQINWAARPQLTRGKYTYHVTKPDFALALFTESDDRYRIFDSLMNGAVELTVIARLMITLLWSHASVTGKVDLSFSQLADLCGIKLSTTFYRAIKELIDRGYIWSINGSTEVVEASLIWLPVADSRRYSFMDDYYKVKRKGLNPHRARWYLNPIHPNVESWQPPLQILVAREHDVLKILHDFQTELGVSGKLSYRYTSLADFHWGYKVVMGKYQKYEESFIAEKVESTTGVPLFPGSIHSLLSSSTIAKYCVDDYLLRPVIDSYQMASVSPFYNRHIAVASNSEPHRTYPERFPIEIETATGRVRLPTDLKRFVNCILSVQRSVDELVQLALFLKPDKAFTSDQDVYGWLNEQKHFVKAVKGYLPLRGVLSDEHWRCLIIAVVALELSKFFELGVEGFCNEEIGCNVEITVLPVLAATGEVYRIAITNSQAQHDLLPIEGRHRLIAKVSGYKVNTYGLYRATSIDDLLGYTAK